MTLLKEQIKAANLESTEEEYLYKLALYCGDARMMTSWQNDGVAPADAVKRAQLEGLSRRSLAPACCRRPWVASARALSSPADRGHSFSRAGRKIEATLTISRMPTFRRRFEAVVKALLQEARQGLQKNGNVIEQAL
ncbi:hypothetical protein BHM03_00006959 [Ensete ventricosum]|nr:hypothetical protein BHM03_00006959 [Ensete ventricosum]